MFGDPKRQIEKYFRKNQDVKCVVVMGTYGRKSAIRAIGSVLGEEYVVTMGVNKKVHPDVILLDYRSMEIFPNIEPDISVITSCVTEEEAKNYFALANKSRRVVVNFSDVPQKFAKYLMNPEVTTYGDELPADFYFENHDSTLEDGFSGDIVNPQREHIPVTLKVLGEHNVRPLTMAAAVAKMFQIPREHIVRALENMRPLDGRMQPCKGLHGSIIIDDSADIGETSVYYGLRAIYSIEAPSRIVVTDNLAKLGKFDESHIDEVVVLGQKIDHNIKGAKISFFEDRLDMLNYLGQHFEQKGIVLLEIPVPEIIEGDIWE